MASRLLNTMGHNTLPTVAVATSPRASLGAEGPLACSPSQSSMLARVWGVMKRYHCGHEEEQVSICIQAAQAAATSSAAAKPSALLAGGPCGSSINALRYCQLHTQQHNYPVAPAFLY